MINDREHLLAALAVIPHNLPRADWWNVVRGAVASGIPEEEIWPWCKTQSNCAGRSDLHASITNPPIGNGTPTHLEIAKQRDWKDPEKTDAPGRDLSPPFASGEATPLPDTQELDAPMPAAAGAQDDATPTPQQTANPDSVPSNRNQGKRPSFQFYPADWRNNANLHRCSLAAQGAWMSVLCVLHDSDEYGICRWNLADLAKAAGVSIKLLKELSAKNVLKGSDQGCDAFIYTPRSGGKDGKSVTLIEAVVGSPCWFSSRFVRDEYVRRHRGLNSQFSKDDQPENTEPKPDSAPLKVTPKPPFGGDKGDCSTSTSSSSSSINTNAMSLPAEKPPKADLVPYEKIVSLYHEMLPMCPRVAKLTPKRKGQIAARWKSGDIPDLETWREYFEFVAQSKFLTGKIDPTNGHKRFVADLEWLTNESNFTKTWEKKYHGG